MPFWLLSPAGIIILALIVAPLVLMIWISFTDYNQRTLFTGEFHYVGFAQYAAALTSPAFWYAVMLSIALTAAMVVGSLAIGMGVAHLMTKTGTVMRYVVTVVLIFAWGMPNVASAQVWTWLFQPTYGIVNWFLTQLGVFGNVMQLSWTGNVWLALTSVWLLVVWQAVPFIALTTYAAQTQVDQGLVEAARIDGASEVRIYFSVILNEIKPTVLLLTVLSIMWDFNIFNQLWLVTQGGPLLHNGIYATANLGIWSYMVAFLNNDYASGAAIAVITSILLLIISAFYIRSLLRSGEDL